MYVQSDRLDAAIDALERGDAAGFQSATHWYSVAARLVKDEEYERSLALFAKAIELDPESAEIERSLAAALEKLGREDEAIPHLKRYLELKPDASDSQAVTAKIKASEAG
jgi:tetratricopeptide (TPR) repeat protein